MKLEIYRRTLTHTAEHFAYGLVWIGMKFALERQNPLLAAFEEID